MVKPTCLINWRVLISATYGYLDWESSDAPVRCCMPISSNVLKQNELRIQGGWNFFRPSTQRGIHSALGKLTTNLEYFESVWHEDKTYRKSLLPVRWFLYSGHQCRSTSPFKATITRTSCNSIIVGLSGNAMGSNDSGGYWCHLGHPWTCQRWHHLNIGSIWLPRTVVFGRFFQALSRLPAVLRAWRQIEMAQILLSQFQEQKQTCFCQLSGNLLIYSQVVSGWNCCT